MPTVHQRHGQTDGRTTYDSNTALAVRAWRGKMIEYALLVPLTTANIFKSCE